MFLPGVFIVGFIISFTPGEGSATVVGDCQVCHGRFPGMMEATPTTEPQQFVLRNEICVNCHTGTGSESVKMLGGANVPVVYSTKKPEKFLSGGDFYFVSRPFGDRKGHNVNGVTFADAKYEGTPPGYSEDADPSKVGYDPKSPLTCSGSNGCHGNRNIADPLRAILGSHHAQDEPVDGSTSAQSFRYLKNTDEAGGVVGFEDRDWGATSSPEDHNEYTSSINGFCNGCHNRQHGQGDEGPWFRHPVGEIIPDYGEYADYRTYSLGAPVGRPTVPEGSSVIVRPGRDRIICLSCHFAHGGPHDSVLRWDYEKMITGLAGKGGCFACHTSKAD